MEPDRGERTNCAKQAEDENSKENGLICLPGLRVRCCLSDITGYLTAQMWARRHSWYA
jgi:hypothetical protein